MDVINAVGDYIAQFPYFPVMHTVHCLATTASIRSQPGSLEFSHNHPLASLAGNTMIINAGGILVAAALGKPLMGPFTNMMNILTAVFIWWLVYFGPGDIAFKFYKFKPLQILLMAVRETRRCKKILWAVNSAAAVFDGHSIPLILVGALGGCSGKFLQTAEESMRKHSADISKGEFLQISFVTKASLLISTVFSMIKIEVLPLTIAQGLFLCSLALVSLNLGMTLAGLPDPFHPIANATWRMMSIARKEVPVNKVASKDGEGGAKKDN
ncbi:hypothetical protein ACHWQZ_G012398 [Mnemiopsis leidyi]